MTSLPANIRIPLDVESFTMMILGWETQDSAEQLLLYAVLSVMASKAIHMA